MELFVGKKIELLREDGGMSQGELAKVLGVTRQTVSKWEADVCRPKVKVLQAICGVFGVDMSYFTGEEVSPQQICTLGEFIRKLRRRAKLSQEQFAERMGVSRRMISLWETDEVKPRARVLQKLGECFCMDEEERQQLQLLAAEECAQSPAAEEVAEGRALADAAEGACGQNAAENAAEDRLAAEFAVECAAAAAPPAPLLEAFTGDAQLFALQGAAVPIAEWAVSPAEEEACAAPKARRKPWAAVAALSAAMLLVVAVAAILICMFLVTVEGDQVVQSITGGLTSRGVIVLVSIVAALLLAGGAALMVHLLKSKKKAQVRPKVGKRFTKGGN
ncbi:MAG TPA: helix-turn-helix domain-containing protein [Candidatus Borkfalkia faecavium]|uniref:Helix-turn-helix domain-containing protein n=1 Tax=Candidatus Borkfalkia faecavium TaxID=2838508 RepID=A0A9D2AV71_9FIRM|nr:helix-turn-helix domain-containing protein [Candidatus Borkfalkia faecavium]